MHALTSLTIVTCTNNKNIYVDINFIHSQNIFKSLETPLKIQISLMLCNAFIHIIGLLLGILTIELMYNIMLIIEINDILNFVQRITHFTLVF